MMVTIIICEVFGPKSQMPSWKSELRVTVKGLRGESKGGIGEEIIHLLFVDRVSELSYRVKARVRVPGLWF